MMSKVSSTNTNNPTIHFSCRFITKSDYTAESEITAEGAAHHYSVLYEMALYIHDFGYTALYQVVLDTMLHFL